MKNKWILVAVIALGIFTLAAQCDKEKVNTEKNNLPELTITLDQTAWFCMNECRYNFTFREETVVTQRFDAPNDENPLWVCERKANSANWQAIVKALDLDALAQTEATIGCPGCADEPIETLKVTTGDFSHEVRMNMGTEVPGIQDLLNVLRDQSENFKNRNNCQ